MNIIKHILCVSFAMTAWSAYGMFGFGDSLTNEKIPAWKLEEMNAIQYGLEIADQTEQKEYFDCYYAYTTSPEYLEMVQRSPKAKDASKQLLSEALPFSAFFKAQQETSPSKKLPTTPTTSPTKKLHFLDQPKKNVVRKRLTFDQ